MFLEKTNKFQKLHMILHIFREENKIHKLHMIVHVFLRRERNSWILHMIVHVFGEGKGILDTSIW